MSQDGTPNLDIFINYRRQVDASDARSFYFCCLRLGLPEASIFMDLRNLDAGVEFSKEIQARIERCNVFLAVIGPNWLGISRNGIRRLDEPEDYVRREIEWALQKDKIVIPLLMPGAVLPAEEVLPATIRQLPGRQYEALSHDNFESDCRRVIDKMRASRAGRLRNELEEERRRLEARQQDLETQIKSHEIMQKALMSQMTALSKAMADLEAARDAVRERLSGLRPGGQDHTKWRDLTATGAGSRVETIPRVEPRPKPPPTTSATECVARMTGPSLPHPMIRFEPGVEVLQVFSASTSQMTTLSIEIDRAFAVSERLVTIEDWSRVIAGSGAPPAIGDDPKAARTLVAPDEIGTYLACLNRRGGGYFLWSEREWLFAVIRLGKASGLDFLRPQRDTEMWEWLAEPWQDYASRVIDPATAASLHSGVYAWTRMDALWATAGQNLHTRRPYLSTMRASDIGFRIAVRL